MVAESMIRFPRASSVTRIVPPPVARYPRIVSSLVVIVAFASAGLDRTMISGIGAVNGTANRSDATAAWSAGRTAALGLASNPRPTSRPTAAVPAIAIRTSNQTRSGCRNRGRAPDDPPEARPMTPTWRNSTSNPRVASTP